MTIKNDIVPATLDDLTAPERELWDAAKSAGSAKKSLDMATGKMESARTVMKRLLKPYAGSELPDRVRTFCLAGFIMGRAGCGEKRAFEIVEKGPKAAKASDLQAKAHATGKMTLSRAAKDAGAVSPSANAGNDSASGSKGAQTRPTETSTREPVQPGSSIVEVPEYRFPAIPGVGSRDQWLAWLLHECEMGLDMATGPKNAAHRDSSIASMIKQHREMERAAIRDAQAKISEAAEKRKNRTAVDAPKKKLGANSANQAVWPRKKKNSDAKSVG